jgi:UDP-N-acetylmuramyl pentapeptide phosphotransferase/UDP-N-acetylglucosamine-1-phosphate transferase
MKLDYYHLILFIVAVALSILYYKIAKWLNFTDQPIGRSSHSSSTVTGIGIIFPIVFLCGYSLIKITPPIDPIYVIGLMMLALISYTDDILFVKHSVRFVFQIFAIVLLLVALPFGELTFSLIPIYLAAGIFGIGVINAYNFMDGINGMLGLNLLSTLVCFFLINDVLPASDGEPLHFVDTRLLVGLISCSIIFLFYNFRRKAWAFAGDVGAISIGFINLFLMYSLILETQNYAYLLLFIVFGIDAGVTVFYKIILRENIFVPHRDFLFKKLVHIAKMKHLHVSSLYALVQLVIGLVTVLFLRNIPKTSQVAVLFTAIVGLVAVYIYYRNKLTRKRHERPVQQKGKLTTTYKKIS